MLCPLAASSVPRTRHCTSPVGSMMKSTQVEAVGELPHSHGREIANPSPVAGSSEKKRDGPVVAGLNEDEQSAAAVEERQQRLHDPDTAAVAAKGKAPQHGVEVDVEDDFLYVNIEASEKKDGEAGGGLRTEASSKIKPRAAGAGAKAEAAVAPAEGQHLLASRPIEALANLVRSLSTPMMDGTEEPRDNNEGTSREPGGGALPGKGRSMAARGKGSQGPHRDPPRAGSRATDDWSGLEDPDWKANHQLSWGQLTDVREIGKGLTCTVYTARIPGRKTKVIAKVARRRNKGRLEDQAERQLEAEFNVLRQASEVNHPHVVELLGAGFTPEGRRFLLLEHLPEGTLGTFHALSAREEMRGPSAYRTLKQGFRRLTKDLSYTLGRVLQVAEALQYLHSDAIPGAVVLHRDIRPDNVGIALGGVVKIFDFGLSKALVKGHDLVGEAGSLRYAAPEVSMALPHGDKADVYSWALLAWSVASGHPPFEGIGRSAFYARVVVGGERPDMDPTWPRGFQSLLKDCWSGDPSLRPDMTEVVIRMKALLHVSH
ncbi:unnamed protein product [Pylaiella littoralis]